MYACLILSAWIWLKLSHPFLRIQDLYTARHHGRQNTFLWSTTAFASFAKSPISCFIIIITLLFAMPNDDILTDDYVAGLLAKEAGDCSIKYSAMGMEAFNTNSK